MFHVDFFHLFSLPYSVRVAALHISVFGHCTLCHINQLNCLSQDRKSGSQQPAPHACNARCTGRKLVSVHACESEQRTAAPTPRRAVRSRRSDHESSLQFVWPIGLRSVASNPIKPLRSAAARTHVSL